MATLSRQASWIVLALAAIVVVLSLYVLRDQGGDTVDEFAGGSGESSQAAGLDRSEPVEASTEAESVVDDSPATPGDDSRITLSAEGKFLSGRVTDSITGNPVTTFEVRLRARQLGGVTEEIIREIVEDRGGHFRFEIPSAYKYGLTVNSSRYPSAEFDHLYGDDEESLTDIEVMLDPGTAISGRVVDDATGESVAGAFIGIGSGASKTSFLWVGLLGYTESFRHAWSDEKGLFTLHGIHEKIAVVAVLHPEYTQGFEEIPTESPGDCEIRLERGFCVFGQALDDHGRAVEGLLVKITGGKLPLSQYCLTDVDGRYRSYPLPEGKFTVSAEPPPGRTEDDLGFSKERTELVIEDGDVELNFGPDPGCVTWRGTLFGRDEKPIARGRIEVTWDSGFKKVRSPFASRRSAQCDEKGAFELCKIRPGRYHLRIEIPRLGTRIGSGKITLNEPGIVEQDIHIAGGEIRGVVIDGETGKPFTKRPGYVVAENRNRNVMDLLATTNYGYLFNTCRSDIDEKGEFRLIGLENGPHNVYAVSWGAATTYPHDVVIYNHEVIEGVEIVIPAQGLLDLRLSNFNTPRHRTFTLTFVAGQNTWGYAGDNTVDNNGALRVSYVKSAGKHRLMLSFKYLGVIDREFIIVPNETTIVAIDGSDLELALRPKTVAGIVSYTDGEPVAGAKVKLQPFNVAAFGGMGGGSYSQSRSATTDQEGRYEFPGVYCGNWWVRVGLEDSDLEFPDLNVSPTSDEPIRLDLAIPRGRVTGILCDSVTGLPLDCSESMIWLRLVSADSPRTIAEGRAGVDGSFCLVGAGSASFKFTASSRNIEKYESQPFFVTDGQVIDLGNVMLRKKAPSGGQ